MADAKIWYCTSTVPEEFPQCLAKELTSSSNSGKWVFTDPTPNLYYRIWALFPNSYSQTIMFLYSGGEKYWGTFILANNPTPIQPAIRIVSPNGGEQFGLADNMTIRWTTQGVPSSALINLTLFRSDVNPVKEAICNLSANCTESTYNWVANIAYKTANDGVETWPVSASGGVADDNYFVRATCSTNCGADDSDIPFRIGSAAIVAPPPPPPPPPPAAVIPPPPVSPIVVVTKPATEEIIVSIPDGARVSVGPQAAILTGNVTVEVNPSIETPKESGISILSSGYDIVIKDASGLLVRDLIEEIEITLPYKDTDLTKNKVNEDDIYPGFFDEIKKEWKKIENFTIDKVKNTVSAKVKHLTRFAIVAAADITPPDAPTGVSAEAVGEATIKISWKNPLKDFYNSRIYRSEISGKLGTVIARDVFSQQFINKNLTNGVTYYYTVHSVDPAGNESANKNQVSAKAIGISIEPPKIEEAQESTIEEESKAIQIPPQEKVEDASKMPKSKGFFTRFWEELLNFLRNIF